MDHRSFILQQILHFNVLCIQRRRDKGSQRLLVKFLYFDVSSKENKVFSVNVFKRYYRTRFCWLVGKISKE